MQIHSETSDSCLSHTFFRLAINDVTSKGQLSQFIREILNVMTVVCEFEDSSRLNWLRMRNTVFSRHAFAHLLTFRSSLFYAKLIKTDGKNSHQFSLSKNLKNNCEVLFFIILLICQDVWAAPMPHQEFCRQLQPVCFSVEP